MLVTLVGRGGAPMVWLMLVVLLIVPVLVIKALVDFSSVLDAVASAWRRVRGRPAPEPTGPPVQRLAADLSRLSAHFVQVDESDAPAKAFRLRAVALAYDGVLLDAARTLDVPAPEQPPLRSIERLQTEAALAQQGLVW
jgi:hypothetical protein